MKIYTVGHSTRSFEDFLELLRHYNIELIIDVRRFPTSKKFPWFNKENLEKELPKNGIEYLHYPELGGYREEGYEAFSQTKEFSTAIKRLLEIINGKMVAIMCAEIKWWKCHRRYIANKLAELDNEVVHIFDVKRVQKHKLLSKEIDEKMKTTLPCDRFAKKIMGLKYNIPKKDSL